MSTPFVAPIAKRLLERASGHLGLPNPARELDAVIDQSLAFEPSQAHGTPFAPNFAETTPETLGVVITPDGPYVTPSDRVETTTRALQRIVRDNFGNRAASWLDGKLEEVRGDGYARAVTHGASFGSAFDRNGVTESFAQYEWGPMMHDALPAPLFRLVRTAMQALPGLTPAFSTVRCGRTSGSQQVSFTIDRAIPLNSLQPLMQHLGVGERHAGLMSALAFVLGARFTLPPDSALLTLRPTNRGVEVRVDVNLDALPDPPAQLMALMRLQMTERPKSLQGLDRWLMALTPDGLPGPGTVSVLSAWVRPDLPARLAIYLRPALFDAPQAELVSRQPAVPAAAASVWDTPSWAPIH